MKLTKQKLYQLIIEAMRPRQASTAEKTFDKRRQYSKGGTIRAVSDENKAINYPEYQDKLTTLAGDDYAQARELASALDEPLDIKFDPTDMQTFNIQPSAPAEMQNLLWFDYVMQGYAENFVDPIDPDYFEKYIKDEGISQDKKQEIYNKLEAERRKVLQRSYINLPKSGYERTKELEDLYGFDFRPDWMKRSAFN